MSTETMTTETLPPAIERALVDGDLSKLTAEERATLYRQTCESLGLNLLTMPLSYLRLNGKLVLYARRDCTDQLRALHKISIEIVSMKTDRDLFTVHVRARDLHGRVDEDVGFAVIGNLKGEALGNAELKAVSKAKRRVTLSICGLGMLDESEVASIPEARTYPVEAAPAPRMGAEPAPLNASEPRPSAEDIDVLFALAESCREPKEAFGTRLRRILGVDGETRISKRFLRDTMTVDQFQQAREYYETLLRSQVEDDVPDHAPPADQVA
jgi:hypothetical protein